MSGIFKKPTDLAKKNLKKEFESSADLAKENLENKFELIAGYVRVGNLQGIQDELDAFKNRPEQLKLLLNMKGREDGRTLVEIATETGHYKPKICADIVDLLVLALPSPEHKEKAKKEIDNIINILKKGNYAVELDPVELDKHKQVLFARLEGNVENTENTENVRRLGNG